MIFDRSYMHYRDDYAKMARDAMNAVWMLIAANIFCFLLSNFGNDVPGSLLLFPNARQFHPWQPFTYMFFHANFTHILFNMYGLYLFGSLVAPILGRRRFLLLYFISGLCGAFLWLFANWGNPYPALGASGALFGVMVAVAMLRPNQEFFIFFVPVPVKSKTLVVVYALIEIMSEWRGFGAGIAHLAHLGGFVGGYLYLILFCKRDVIWSFSDLFRRRGPHFYRASDAPPPQPGPAATNTDANGGGAGEKPITKVSQQEVDRLLDKISREGINSLTDYERAELQFFREQMRGSGR